MDYAAARALPPGADVHDFACARGRFVMLAPTDAQMEVRGGGAMRCTVRGRGVAMKYGEEEIKQLKENQSGFDLVVAPNT